MIFVQKKISEDLLDLIPHDNIAVKKRIAIFKAVFGFESTGRESKTFMAKFRLRMRLEELKKKLGANQNRKEPFLDAKQIELFCLAEPPIILVYITAGKGLLNTLNLERLGDHDAEDAANGISRSTHGAAHNLVQIVVLFIKIASTQRHSDCLGNILEERTEEQQNNGVDERLWSCTSLKNLGLFCNVIEKAEA